MVHLRSGPRFGLGKFFSVIVTSSDMDKKLEIDKKNLENKLEID